MRQNIKWLGILFIVPALLIGCSNDDGADQQQDGAVQQNDGADNTTPDNDEGKDDATANNEGKNDTTTNEETVVDAPYDFIDLEIDVDIDGVESALEVEYEVERSKIDASYENKADNIDLEDEEAMAEIEPIFNTFTFDENSSKDEILEQILDGFSIEAYDKIEIEVTFKDQSKLKFER